MDHESKLNWFSVGKVAPTGQSVRVWFYTDAGDGFAIPVKRDDGEEFAMFFRSNGFELRKMVNGSWSVLKHV